MSTDILVVGSGTGTLRALDAYNGSVRWIYHSGHPYYGPALAQVDTAMIAAALDGHLCMLRVDDGAVLWETKVPDVVAALPAPGGGPRIGASSDRIAVHYGSRVVGVAPINGSLAWEYSFSPTAWGRWLLSVGAQHVYVLEKQLTSAPSATRAPSEQASGEQPNPARATYILTALSAQDGIPQWSTSDHSASEPPWDGSPSLAEADGVVYAYGQGLHALSASTGVELWSRNSVPEHHVGMLAVGRAEIMLAAGAHLGAYRRDTGVPEWSEVGRTGDGGYFESFDRVLVMGDVAYIGRSEFNPRGFRVESRVSSTGALRWVWPDGGGMLRPDIAWRLRGAGDMLYVPSLDALHAIRTSDGARLWYTELSDPAFALLAVA